MRATPKGRPRRGRAEATLRLPRPARSRAEHSSAARLYCRLHDRRRPAPALLPEEPMRPVCLPALLLLALLMPPVAGAAPSDVEQRILRSVDAQQPAALSLLQRAVDINSGTMNFEGVRAVGALFRAELDQLGFTTQWIDGTPWKRAGHLVAERKGKAKN